MWSFQTLFRINYKLIVLVLLIQLLGCMTIAAFSAHFLVDVEEVSRLQAWMQPAVRSQISFIILGWMCFCGATMLDYNKLREWTWFFYFIALLALMGLFFTDPIVRVQRWYKIPGLGISLQPSELAKLTLVITLSWFFERRSTYADSWGTFFWSLLITGVPFLLIVKQPDLGTALVLYPITLVIMYIGGVKRWLLSLLCIPGACATVIVALIFSGALPYESLRPYVLQFLKEYQYARINPDTHHQRASQIAIALGGVSGSGWRQGDFWRSGALPAPYTDSIFAAFGEEFGLIGLLSLLALYYAVIALSFKAALVAKDSFGRLMAAGLSIYLAVHILINIGMMSGCLPITGVPLVLMSYGGSSMIVTMTALGLIQSVYARRFMF